MKNTTAEQLKAWKLQEQAVERYTATFTDDQMKKLREKVTAHIKNQDTFKFGPKGDKMYCKIRGDKASAVKDFGVHIWLGSDPDELIELYPIFLGPAGLKDRVEVCLNELLGMVALWDITLKDYFIHLSRKQGFEP